MINAFEEPQIRSFCLYKEEIPEIVNRFKVLWPGVVVYVNPGNVIEVKVYHDAANVSDIIDVVKQVRPDYNIHKFMKGRYGYFVDYTTEAPNDESVIL